MNRELYKEYKQFFIYEKSEKVMWFYLKNIHIMKSL